MKKDNKNFIAFTLSEMLIVILILSVISAATLPAITGKRDKEEMETPAVSAWNYANVTKGHYYSRNRIFVGTSTYSQTREGGSGPLVLYPSHVNSSLMAEPPKTDIYFYHKNRPAGHITLDSYGNTAMGYYAGQYALMPPSDDFISGKTSNTFLGLYAGYGAHMPLKTTYIGSYAGYEHLQVYNNTEFDSESQMVLMGPDIRYSAAGSGSIAIGDHAFGGSGRFSSAYADSIKSSIGIGTYAFYRASSYYFDKNYGRSIAIGYYSGIYNNSFNRPEKFVAIGSYSLSSNSSDSCNEIGDVNIGSYTESRSKVAIGYYAASGSKLNPRAIAIGSYSGYIFKGYFGGEAAVNIGHYAGAGYRAAEEDVNIGAYANYYASSTTNGRESGGASVFIGSYAGCDADARSSVIIGAYALTRRKHASGVPLNYGNVVIGERASEATDTTKIPSIWNSVVIGYGTDPRNKDGFIISTPVNRGHNIVIGRCGQLESDFKNCINAGDSYNEDTQYGLGSLWTRTYKNQHYYDAAKTHKMSEFLFTPSYSATAIDDTTSIILYANNVYSRNSDAFAYTSSDRRLKENLKLIHSDIDKFRKINVYRYNMKGDKKREPRVGVLAQELKEIYPNAVDQVDEKSYLTVNASWIQYSMVQALKDVDKFVQKLQNELKGYYKQYVALMNKIDSIETSLNKLLISNVNMNKRLDEVDRILSKANNR